MFYLWCAFLGYSIDIRNIFNYLIVSSIKNCNEQTIYSNLLVFHHLPWIQFHKLFQNPTLSAYSMSNEFFIEPNSKSQSPSETSTVFSRARPAHAQVPQDGPIFRTLWEAPGSLGGTWEAPGRTSKDSASDPGHSKDFWFESKKNCTISTSCDERLLCWWWCPQVPLLSVSWAQSGLPMFHLAQEDASRCKLLCKHCKLM